MDINIKPEKQDPAKAEAHEMNDDELDAVSGGGFVQPTPTPAPSPIQNGNSY